MRYRKLRIAFSATCLIACVLLIAMWVRSYWWTCGVTSYGTGSDSSLFVERGDFGATYYLLPTWSSLHPRWFGQPVLYARDMPGLAGFYYGTNPGDNDYTLLLIPLWFVVMLIVAASMLPWIPGLRWYFTLRTLLIATTLGAVVLGLIMWLQ